MLPRMRKKCPWVSHFGFLCTRLVHEHTYLSSTLSLTCQTSWTKNNNIEGEEAKTFVNVSTILNADVDVYVTNMVDGRSNSMQNAHVTLSGCLGPFLLKRKWGLKEKRFLLCLGQINKDKSVNYIERFLYRTKINEELYHFIFCPPFELLGIYLDVVHWRCPFVEKLPQVWRSGIALMDLLTRIVNEIRIKYLLTRRLCGHKHL